MYEMKDLSIVVPTCQRAALLEQCIASIERGVRCDYELVVVDGGSTDATTSVLDRARQRLGSKLIVIREEKREGFTKAANKGFHAATGRFMTWLNDDARPLPGTMERAIEQITAAGSDVGLLALFHAWHGIRSVAYEMRIGGSVYRLLHVRGTLYANFGLGRRETFSSLGFFDERFFVNGCDPDFSLKVWESGMKVEPAYQTAIDHDEHEDARRHADSAQSVLDNDLLFSKWNLPDKNLIRNDFDPHQPCTLQGRREPRAA
jgi:O-antigen biosynthesis protein